MWSVSRDSAGWYPGEGSAGCGENGDDAARVFGLGGRGLAMVGPLRQGSGGSSRDEGHEGQWRPQASRRGSQREEKLHAVGQGKPGVCEFERLTQSGFWGGCGANRSSDYALRTPTPDASSSEANAATPTTLRLPAPALWQR